jgi:hypothetical protein
MRLAISAQERPARDALTVVVSYVNPTRKPVVDAARSSAHPVYVASKPAPEKSLSGLQQRSALQKRIAAPELCESVLWTEKKE